MKSTLDPSFRYTARLISPEASKSIWRSLIVAGAIVLLLVAMFSPDKARLQCSGKMSTKFGFSPAAVHVNLERHRWALRAWSDSKGSFRLEIPREALHHYEILQDDGDRLDLVLGDEQQFGGTYSTSGGQLAVRTPQGMFVGACSEIN